MSAARPFGALALWTAALALLLALAANALAAPDFPKLTGRVVDAAGLIDPAREAAIDAKLAGLETATGRQLVVATIPDLGGYEIADYGYQLGRAWGIGDKDRDDGALLIVAPAERKVRVEVGYGLEPVLTDALSHMIIQTRILPAFRAGDMAGGIEAGVDALIEQLQLPAEEAERRAAQAAQSAARSDEGGGGLAIFLVFLFLFFILPMLLGRKRGRRYGRGPVIIWGPGMGGGWGGGGGGWGGGGFSGGGGGFGGGGASGGW